MSNNKKRQLNNNHGSAMLVAIIVGIVVVGFSLSLLLVSYSLYASSTKKAIQLQMRELANSVSMELSKELTIPKFDTSEEFEQSLNQQAGCKYPMEMNTLWYYLRYNIQQGNWPYLGDETVLGHSKEEAYRYFKITPRGGDSKDYASMADEISVCLYWKLGDDMEKDGTILCMEITVARGDEVCVIENYYELSVHQDDTGNASFVLADVNINPNANAIDTSELWHWEKINQE